jgi:rhodanese-related sulfurtransferase
MDPTEEQRLRRIELAKRTVPQVGADEVEDRNAHVTVVIDVRDAAAYGAQHIEGAINIEANTLAERIASLVPDRATPILCHCNGGTRGPLAALALQELGYRNVGAIAGGLRAYAALGDKDDAAE